MKIFRVFFFCAFGNLVWISQFLLYRKNQFFLVFFLALSGIYNGLFFSLGYLHINGMAKGTFLKFLNFNQASYRCILSLQFVMSGWGTGYSFGCDLLDPSRSPQAMRVRAEEMLLYLPCENLCPVGFFFFFFSCNLAPGLGIWLGCGWLHLT